MSEKINFVFFGTSEFSKIILDELKICGFVPKAIVSSPDQPVGRKMIITPPPTKIWADKRGIISFQPKTLREEKDPGVTEKVKKLTDETADLFIVASYGKIIPKEILEIPKHGTLNVHPSLLPKLRGPSPIRSSILSENETGVSIMLLDPEVDHGPIISQEKIIEWPGSEPPYAKELEELLAHRGGKILARILPDWVAGKINPEEQDHDKATFTKKIEKENGELNLNDLPENNLRKVRAYQGWPYAYFFIEKNGQKMRVKITEANIREGQFNISKVIPEGKKEMSYEDFKRGLKN